MASGFYALFDDIATILDDVATMSKDLASITKVAGKKTSGLLSDDLAVNAEKASGFTSSRELPVLWKITKGSFLNKLIILPIAFLLTAFLPSTIIPILLIGGIYLAYEGAEKIYHFFFPSTHKVLKVKTVEMTADEVLEYENKKIKSAIIVDFILSVEIIIIALSTVVEKELTIQIIVVTIVAIIATIGVYGIVAIIVRMDDFGYKLVTLSKKERSISKTIGLALVNLLPIVIRGLAIVGTIAMILVAGGIYVHNIHFLHDIFPLLPTLLIEFFIGLIVGFIALFVVKVYLKIKK